MAAIDNEKDPLIVDAVGAIMSAHYTMVSLASNSDGFGPKSLEKMAQSATERLEHAMSLLGYSKNDVLDMQIALSANIAEGMAKWPDRRWEPYVDDDCPGNTAVRST